MIGQLANGSLQSTSLHSLCSPVSVGYVVVEGLLEGWEDHFLCFTGLRHRESFGQCLERKLWKWL